MELVSGLKGFKTSMRKWMILRQKISLSTSSTNDYERGVGRGLVAGLWKDDVKEILEEMVGLLEEEKRLNEFKEPNMVLVTRRFSCLSSGSTSLRRRASIPHFLRCRPPLSFLRGCSWPSSEEGSNPRAFFYAPTDTECSTEPLLRHIQTKIVWIFLKLKTIGLPMDNTSESSSTRPWLWVIETLVSCGKIENYTLQAPAVPSDFERNTIELVARRCLEGSLGSAGGLNFDAPSSLDSRLGFAVSRSCEDVLHQILHEVPLSSADIAGVESIKPDVYPFIDKRAGSIKLELEQLKESVIEGTHPCADRLKERSELTLQKQDYPVPANDGKCNDLSEKDNRDHSFDVHDMQYLHEKQVDVEKCDDFLRSEKKNKCYPLSNIEFKNDKSCQTTSFLEAKVDNEHHIVPVPASIDDPGKVQRKSSKSQSEQDTDIQQKEPNAAYPNEEYERSSQS
ncbi:uncharacterized protein LOC129292487 [Prosopis cineraria]|uniref:uncharacterized protein LOC129292487 n=1 Tax=Prosopis cineraria TaxID=364024 RepID=UPI00240FC051|nr:uncharacterized protein LOC129292487 [Prosopis cineraria]